MTDFQHGNERRLKVEWISEYDYYPVKQLLFLQVEESMENLLDVVAGAWPGIQSPGDGWDWEPGRRWAYNELGIGYWHKCTEHFVPLRMNSRFQWTTAFSGPWQQKYMKLRREKQLAERDKKLRRIHAVTRSYKKIFPDAEIETDLSEFENTLAKTAMKGPAEGTGGS